MSRRGRGRRRGRREGGGGRSLVGGCLCSRGPWRRVAVSLCLCYFDAAVMLPPCVIMSQVTVSGPVGLVDGDSGGVCA